MKYIKLLSLVVLSFFAQGAYAIDASNIQVFPIVYSHDAVELSANLRVGTDMPTFVWFEYGSSETNLNQQTEKEEWDRGYHLQNQKVKELSAQTDYYFRGVMQVESVGIFRTDVVKFTTFEDYSLIGSTNSEGSEPKPISTSIKNPFDFFGSDDEENGEEVEEGSESEEEDSTVEYQEEPVGGIVHKESVYYGDEEGEVIEYSDEYRNALKPKKEKNNGFLIFILLLLIALVAILLYRMRQKRVPNPDSRRARMARLNQYRRPQRFDRTSTLQQAPPQEPQARAPLAYQKTQEGGHAGVERAQPEGTFFRKPPQK